MNGSGDAPAGRGAAALLGGELGAALRRTAADGACHVAGVLGRAQCRELLAEVKAGEFAALPEVQGPYGVRQQATHSVLEGDDIAVRPRVDTLCRAVVAAVREHAGDIAGLDAWTPNEVSVQRYEPGSTGITVHRDGRSYPYLVAIFTLEGSAALRLCADREGTPLAAWDAAAGSVVLLRGPGLDGLADGRPLHAVDGPATAPRTSLTLRMRAR